MTAVLLSFHDSQPITSQSSVSRSMIARGGAWRMKDEPSYQFSNEHYSIAVCVNITMFEQASLRVFVLPLVYDPSANFLAIVYPNEVTSKEHEQLALALVIDGLRKQSAIDLSKNDRDELIS